MHCLRATPSFITPLDVFRENCKLVGAFSLHLVGPDGKTKLFKHKPNLIVNNGFQLISDCLFAQSGRPAVASYIGVGTSSTAPTTADTALGAESARVAATYSYATKVATLTATFNPGVATAGLQEAALFNASTSGTMLNHVTYSIVNKQANDTLTVTFSLTLS